MKEYGLHLKFYIVGRECTRAVDEEKIGYVMIVVVGGGYGVDVRDRVFKVGVGSWQGKQAGSR